MVDVEEKKPSCFEHISPFGSVPLLQDGDLSVYGRYASYYHTITLKSCGMLYFATYSRTGSREKLRYKTGLVLQ